MILSRLDYQKVSNQTAIGIGMQILEHGAYAEHEIDLGRAALELRRRYYGDGVFAIDGGANIGTHAIQWARHMHGWGAVMAFEPQERVFYALAGNLALNNAFNARAVFAALGDEIGIVSIPSLDWYRPANIGGVRLRGWNPDEQDVGQAPTETDRVPMTRIDSFGFVRLDYLKLDVEGCELQALRGAEETIARCTPIIVAETLHDPERKLNEYLEERDYEVFQFDQMNLMAAHRFDKCLDHVRALAETLEEAA